MKLRLIFILILGIGINSCSDDDNNDFTIRCLPTTLQDGVIAYYPFIDGSLNDESPDMNHLTNTTGASATADRAGNPSCAYEFDNSQAAAEFLTTTNTTFLNSLDEFSISIWYEPLDTIRDGGAYETLLGRGDDMVHCPDRFGEWSIGLYDCRKAVFGHDNSVWANDISNNGCQGEIVALTNKWHHVVAVKNEDTYKIYFNGNLEESVTGIGNCNTTFNLAQDIGDLFIGTDYTGKVDDIIIYDRELSSAEVTELHEVVPCCE